MATSEDEVVYVQHTEAPDARLDSLAGPAARQVRTQKPLRSINRIALLVLETLLDAVQASSAPSSSRAINGLQTARDSLRACPVTFRHVSQLEQLQGFESEALRRDVQRGIVRWCKRHNRSLSPDAANIGGLHQDAAEKEKEDNRSASAIHPSVGKNAFDLLTENQTKKPSNRGKKRTQLDDVTNRSRKKDAEATAANRCSSSPPRKVYIPQPRSGTSGILIALYGLTKSEPQEKDDEAGQSNTSGAATGDSSGDAFHPKMVIIQHAQPFSDPKYIPKKSNGGFAGGHGTNYSFHSAWGGIKTLINRGYVYRTGNPARFGLSRQGWQVARTCAERERPGFEMGAFLRAP